MGQDDLQVKRFHLTVPLVEGGRAVAAIVAPAGDEYGALAGRVQAAVRESPKLRSKE